MSYNITEVQTIVAELLEYSCIDEAFADIDIDLINGKFIHNGKGDRYRRILEEFAIDTAIK